MPDGIPSPNSQFPQPIKNVTGNANVKIYNKNLFDYQFASDYSNTTVSSYRFVKIADVKKGQQYNINNLDVSNIENETSLYIYITSKPNYEGITSGNSLCYGSNKLYTTNTSLNAPTTNSYYIGIYPSNINETTYNKILDKFKNAQLEQGTTSTSYVPHKEQNLPFTFAEGQRAMQGTTLEDDGIHQKRKQKIFDGTENWLAFTLQGKSSYYTNLPDGTGQEVKCSHFICQVSSGFPDENKVIYNGTTNKNIVFYTGDTENKLTEWKAYLAEQYANGTPVIVEYKLAESELENNIIPYNEIQQAQYNNIKANASSYDDKTIISSTSNEEGFDMSVVAIADANTIINDIDTRLSAIESEAE